MSEHDWSGWPDDHTDGHVGGDAHGGEAHDAATPDHHVWSADDVWETHHDPAHHDPAHHDDGTAGEAPADGHDDVPYQAEQHHDVQHDPQDDTGDHHLADDDHPADATGGHGMGPVGTDPDPVPDHHLDADTALPFPPTVHVGPLPEPVDGFPWIDTGSLGRVTPATAEATTTHEEHSADLAAYAAADLPPAADPWAELAASDDPATSALARWWSPDP